MILFFVIIAVIITLVAVAWHRHRRESYIYRRQLFISTLLIESGIYEGYSPSDDDFDVYGFSKGTGGMSSFVIENEIIYAINRSEAVRKYEKLQQIRSRRR